MINIIRLNMSQEKRIVCRPHGDGQLTMLLTDEEVIVLLKIEAEHPDLDLVEHLKILDVSSFASEK